jgi:ABC-type transporter Mla maintaining outer membrane lipid asymmetry ATPase subunit MlaF
VSDDPFLELDAVVRNYGSLRPLRIAHFRLPTRERAAIVGLDAAAAETLLNLITAAHVPDRGVVRVFGRSTREIADAGEWMSLLDRFGIVSDRAVLLDAFTVAQNVALPFSLEVDPVSEATLTRVRDLAGQVGLDAARLDRRVGEADPLVRARVNLARAIALDPAALILEHASARLTTRDAASFASDVARVTSARAMSVLALTVDEAFARGLGGRVLTWQPADGVLKEKRGWRFFS